jgi:hypothetical protein
LLEISRIAVEHGERFGDEEDHFTSLEECMVNLTAVVVAVNKSNSKACLVAAQNDFGGGDPPDQDDNYGVDMVGLNGYCWPHGHLSRCSHGRIDADRVITLGMVFHIVEEPVGECQWFLQCTWFDDDESV